MTSYLSCGHQADPCCDGVDVTFEGEDCIAGEGFVPVTSFAVYCHKCAMNLAAIEERAKIVAWLRERCAHIMTLGGISLPDAIERGEHL